MGKRPGEDSARCWSAGIQHVIFHGPRSATSRGDSRGQNDKQGLLHAGASSLLSLLSYFGGASPGFRGLTPGSANQRVRPRLDRLGERVQILGHVAQIIEDFVEIFGIRVQRADRAGSVSDTG